MFSHFQTFILMTLLTVLFVVAGGLLGGTEGAVIAFVIAIGMNFFSYWFSDSIILKRYRAHEVNKGHEIYKMVSDLAKRAKLPDPKVFVIPEKTPNAFATGRNPEHAAVALTEGLLELLDRDEVKGVIAHELAHIKNRDILTGTIAASLAGAIAMLGQFSQFGSYDSENRNPIGVLLVIVGAPIAAMLIRMAISRQREYEADRWGGLICGQPLALANALNKLKYGVKKYPIKRGNSAHSHLFIVNPFFGGLQSLFATHPPIEERIKKLELLSKELTSK